MAKHKPVTRQVAAYLLSLPERVLRSASGLTAGLVREISDVALPAGIRRTRLYQNMVETTLRFLVKQVGQVEGVYSADGRLAGDFALRRAAGNGIELAGILAFRASPVWVMAALADLSGAGRHLIVEISEALAEEGLLDRGERFETVDQLLDGLERSSGRIATTINTPPLDVRELRSEWRSIRRDLAELPLPAITRLNRAWEELRSEAAAQQRSVFALSSLIALSAIRNLPDHILWLGRSAQVAARRTGSVAGESLLDHYARTLAEIRATGYLNFWIKEYTPYLQAAARQFSPDKETLTQRLLRSHK